MFCITPASQPRLLSDRGWSVGTFAESLVKLSGRATWKCPTASTTYQTAPAIGFKGANDSVEFVPILRSTKMRRYHHVGIPTTEAKPGETHLKHLKVFVVNPRKANLAWSGCPSKRTLRSLISSARFRTSRLKWLISPPNWLAAKS
jgi:hypothetical protein